MKAYLKGNRDEGIKLMKQVEDENQTDSEVWYNFSNLYGLLGDKNRCIHALRNAVNGGYYNYPFMMKDYFFDSVRDDPEFQSIMALAKEKHQAFKEKFFPEKP